MRPVIDHSGSGAPRTLPVNLLLKGRLCLFVGAGHVAHRKLRTVLDHGGRVLLVAPNACPEVRDLVAAGRIEFRAGRYEPGLLGDVRPFLVYAATDDDDLNRRVMEDAGSLGILASSASCWREGDFLSPSVIPWGKGQVSVTTEGASCRQAKFMRLRLAELLGGERDLVVFGVDLRSLTLDELGSVRPDADGAARLLDMLRHLAALEEFAILATCNRLEIYAWTRLDAGLEAALLGLTGLSRFAERVYLHRGEAVVEHAANVVAGHYSEVVCETEITGQFKAAFARAFSENVAGVHLVNLHDRALTLGKRIRARHRAGEAGLPELVADVVRRRMPERGPHVLVLGAGGLGREVAARLDGIPGIQLSWANRRVERIPAEPPGERLDLPTALQRLGEFGQVVSVVGAADPIVRPDLLDGLERPILLLDLGLPRNVDPAVAGLADVELLDLGHFRSPEPDRDRLSALTRAVAVGSGVIHG